MSTSQFIIDDGLHNVVLKNKNGEVFSEFSFNPSDTGRLSRYDSFIEFLESLEIKEDGDTASQILEFENSIKEKIDELFNRNVSESIFKTYSPCTIFANGDMFIEVVIKHMGDVIEKETDNRLKKKVAKIKKATEKNRV